MKAGSYFALLLLVFSFSGVAHADPVPNDFQFQVLDPGNEATLNYLDGTPFNVTFSPGSSCPAAVQGYAAQLGDALFGCYLAYNNSAYTFNSINLVFQNSVGDDSNDNLNGQPADCLTNGAGVLTPAFGSQPTCGLTGGVYDLYYSGGAGLAPGATLVLAEYGPDPSAFGTGVGTVTEATTVTPEPNTLLLLSTGLCVGIVIMRRRNKLLTIGTFSVD
jgi:hypothetical protein